MAKEVPVLDEKEARIEPAEPQPRHEAPPPPASPNRRGRRFLRRWHLIPVGIVLAILVVLAAFASHLFDERLRRSLEGKINQHLKGYSVTLGHAHVNPFNLALGPRD